MNRIVLFLSVMAIAAMTLVSASAGAETREVSWTCPEGVRGEQYECTPGEWYSTTLWCQNGTRMPYSRQCTPQSEPEYVPVETRPFLVIDVSVSGGAFGLGVKPVTGGAMVTLGLELRLTRVVGLEFEGRVGVAGNLYDCQKVKASVVMGGAALMTIRPADIVRMGLGVGGITIRDSSWIKIVDGLTTVIRLDILFYKQVFGLRLQGEVGPAWDATNQLHTWWSASAGLVYAPAVLNKEVSD